MENGGCSSVCFTNIASDTCVWTGGSPFEFNPSFLLNPTFVNESFTHLFFISLVLDKMSST